MPSDTQVASVSNRGLWFGRTISALFTLFLLFDSVIKVLNWASAVEGTTRLGYPKDLVVGIGIAELICVVLYAIPRTSILGAILLTAYLGGATAIQVRLKDPWFLFPIGVGVLVWGGLFLRERRLRALIPLRR